MLNTKSCTPVDRLAALLVSRRVGAHLKGRNVATRTELGQHIKAHLERSLLVQAMYLYNYTNIRDPLGACMYVISHVTEFQRFASSSIPRTARSRCGFSTAVICVEI